MNSAKRKPWANAPEPPMLHVNMRLPVDVVTFFKKEHPEYADCLFRLLFCLF